MNRQGTHFDTIACEYDGVHPAHVVAHYLRKRVALLGPLLGGGKGLDVGCGTGRLLEALRPYGRVMGVDPSEGMLRVLREHRRGEAVRGSAEHLPFADDSFDVVFSVATLHHLVEPGRVEAALREMVRVARPGGRIVVWDHNPLNPYWPIAMRLAPQDRGDERLVPLREISSGLQRAGATVTAIIRSGFVPEFVPRILMPLARAAEWVVERTPFIRRLCAHNVVVAVK